MQGTRARKSDIGVRVSSPGFVELYGCVANAWEIDLHLHYCCLCRFSFFCLHWELFAVALTDGIGFSFFCLGWELFAVAFSLNTSVLSVTSLQHAPCDLPAACTMHQHAQLVLTWCIQRYKLQLRLFPASPS